MDDRRGLPVKRRGDGAVHLLGSVLQELREIALNGDGRCERMTRSPVAGESEASTGRVARWCVSSSRVVLGVDRRERYISTSCSEVVAAYDERFRVVACSRSSADNTRPFHTGHMLHKNTGTRHAHTKRDTTSHAQDATHTHTDTPPHTASLARCSVATVRRLSPGRRPCTHHPGGLAIDPHADAPPSRPASSCALQTSRNRIEAWPPPPSRPATPTCRALASRTPRRAGDTLLAPLSLPPSTVPAPGLVASQATSAGRCRPSSAATPA